METAICDMVVEWIDPQQENAAIKALEKLKGLKARPEEIAANLPFTIARNQPQPNAEKIKNFLEKQGVRVTLKPRWSSPVAEQESTDAVDEDTFLQQLRSIITASIPAFFKSVFKGGFKSIFGSIFKALVGLFIGVVVGLALGFVYNFLDPQGVPEQKDVFAGGLGGIYIYMVVVSGLGGAALGWWLGLKKGIKKAVVKNEVIGEMLDSVTDKLFAFLESRGLTGERQNQLMERIQSIINVERVQLLEKVEGNLTKIPLLGGIVSKVSGKLFDAVCKAPEMVFLNLDVTPEEGMPARKKVVESALSMVEQTFGGAVDAAFSKPIIATGFVAATFVALPYCLLVYHMVT